MTTSEPAGEIIALRVKANGDVIIEGIKGPLQTDGKSHTYVLTSQTVIIRGDVTTLDCRRPYLSCCFLTSLDVSNCTSLTQLYCGVNQLTSLDVSGCTALTELYCFNNRLSSLDVSGCTSLTKLDCSKNSLTSLNLSNCTSLKEFTWNDGKLTSLDVSGCSSLTNLDCNKNQLTSLNVSGCAALAELDCSSNQLTSLDASTCISLTKISCYKNYLKGEAVTQMISSLPNRNQKETGSVYIISDEQNGEENNPPRSDILIASEKNWNVFKYKVDSKEGVFYSGAGNDKIVITTSHKQYLEGRIRLAIVADGDVTIDGIYEKRISTDGSVNTYTLAGTEVTIQGGIAELDCSGNQLTNIDLSNCGSLWSLRCAYNQLTSLDASEKMLLTKLDCSDNQLSSLNILGCPRLATLDCYENRINGDAMTRLVNSLPDRKNMTSGAFRVVEGYKENGTIWCSFADVLTAKEKNWIPQRITGSEKWENYQGVGDGIITLTTTKSVGESINLTAEANGDVVIDGAVFFLQIMSNREYTLTSQTITIRGDITKLICSSDQLNSLNISQTRSLSSIDCSKNDLTNLDLSSCTSLTSLACSRNKLESLDLSACTRLESLECFRNKIRGNAMTQLVESLPDRYGKEPGKFYLVYYSDDEYEENLCYRPDVGHAKDKNWRPQKGRYYHEEDHWEDYFGVIDDGGVIMRTDQEVGSKIALTLEAKGDVVIDGVKGVPETDGKPHQYTLLSQDVTIRGYVTKLHCSGNKLTSLDLSTTVPLVELDCSNNQLTTLDVSQNAALTSLACYRNQIKGEAMAQLIKGLPQLPLRSTHLFGIVSNAADEGNVFLKADVERVRDKGWSPMKWDEERHQYEPYAGKETETFAVTLTKEGKGTITATGANDLTAVPYGTELKIVATPAAGYKLTALTANGEDILATKKVVVKGATEVKATFVDHTGVETTVTQQIQLYPNPATDYLLVEGVAPASEVTLHSLTGERLYAGRADSRGVLQIDLTPYANGVYLVCVAGETYRVVVRR